MEKKYVFWGLFIVIVAIYSGCIWFFSEPYSVSRTVWLPDKYNILNEINGEYGDISEFYLGGSTAEISLEHFKKRQFGKNCTVAIKTNAEIIYSLRENDIEFYAVKDEYYEKGIPCCGNFHYFERAMFLGDSIEIHCNRDIEPLFFIILGAMIIYIIFYFWIAEETHKKP